MLPPRLTSAVMIGIEGRARGGLGAESTLVYKERKGLPALPLLATEDCENACRLGSKLSGVF